MIVCSYKEDFTWTHFRWVGSCLKDTLKLEQAPLLVPSSSPYCICFLKQEGTAATVFGAAEAAGPHEHRAFSVYNPQSLASSPTAH